MNSMWERLWEKCVHDTNIFISTQYIYHNRPGLGVPSELCRGWYRFSWRVQRLVLQTVPCSLLAGIHTRPWSSIDTWWFLSTTILTFYSVQVRPNEQLPRYLQSSTCSELPIWPIGLVPAIHQRQYLYSIQQLFLGPTLFLLQLNLAHFYFFDMFL